MSTGRTSYAKMYNYSAISSKQYKLIMMEKAGTRLVQARKNHPKGLSVPLWPTTMFEGLLFERVAVMRARI